MLSRLECYGFYHKVHCVEEANINRIYSAGWGLDKGKIKPKGGESREEIMVLFAQSGEVSADGREDISARLVRTEPEFFCCNLAMRMSRSARLLSNGTVKSVRNRR